MEIETYKKEHKYIWLDFVLNNDLVRLKWVNDNLADWYSEDILDVAAENGNMEVVKFLVENGKHCTTDAMDLAAKRGNIDILIYLHNKGFRCTDYAMIYAAAYNHFNVVKFLYETRPEGDISIARFWANRYDQYWFDDYIKSTRSYIEKKEIEQMSDMISNMEINI